MIYITSMCFIYVAYLISIRNFKYPVLINLFGLIPFALVIALRGDVGVDTAPYISIVDTIKYHDLLDIFIEPAFLLYSRLLLLIFENSRFVINAIGIINLMAMFFAMRKIDKSFTVFSLLIAPIFLLDYTMNGMRVGMAIPFFILAFYFFNLNRWILAIFFFLCSFLSHITMVYLAFIMLITTKDKIGRYFLVLILPIVTLYFLAPDIIATYLLSKTDSYLNSDAEPIYGLVPLVLNLLLICALLIYTKRKLVISGVKKTCLIIGVLTFIFYLLVPILPWFMVRLMWLNLIYISIVTANTITNNGVKISRVEMLYFFGIGFLGFWSHMRQFILAYGSGDSPFLPYVFFWN